jgi:hypothetical protein
VCYKWLNPSHGFLHSTHFFGTPGETQSTSTMTKDVTEVGAGNIIKTTMEHFLEEQKEVNDMTEFYRELFIDCFTIVHDVKMVQKKKFPRPLLHGETALMTTADVN